MRFADRRCCGAAGGVMSMVNLGYGHTNNIGDDESPVDAGNVNVDVDVDRTVIQIAAGGAYTCALLTGGAVRCWGWNLLSSHGYANPIGDDETPADAGDVNVGGTVAQIVAGGRHTCALLTDGAVRCWGNNHYGQLGYGHTDDIGDDESPVDAGNVNVGGTVTQITAGSDHTCALLTDGAVRCWGWNLFSSLGYGHANPIGDDESPASAGNVNVGGTVTQITAGSDHTCALLTDGAVRCWGWNEHGMLGYGHTDTIGDDETPADAGDVDVGTPVIKLWGDLLR